MADELILLSCWASPYGTRVRISLEEKDLKYEYREEDLANKSDLLLESNPIYKKVPVLIHNGKPVCESLVQLQYIDDVWKHKYPLLPSDPYRKAQALFWGSFVDTKVYEGGRKIWLGKGEQLEVAKKEFIDTLKVLEAEIRDKTYFFGHEFGYVDIVFISVYSWFLVIETSGGFKVEDECPIVMAWIKRCLERKSVSNCLPDQEMVLGFTVELKKMMGIE